MNTLGKVAAVFLVCDLCCGIATGGNVAKYDVTWNSPSADANGSMPLGNGDIGLNAWVEPSGDLVFYISKTDAWGDNARLLKVGRVRVAVDPPLPTEAFRQTLRLREGTMEAVFGEGDDATSIRLWVDANHPAIHVTIDGKTPCTATASVELWRTERYELPSIEVSDVNLDRSKPGNQHAPTIVEPDTVLTNLTDRDRLVSPQRQVGWSGTAREDAGRDRVRAARPAAASHIRRSDRGGRLAGDWTIHICQSPRSNTHRLSIFVLTMHPSSPEQWLAAMEQTIADIERTELSKIADAAHERWWADFWNRSWIDVTTRDDAAAVSLDSREQALGEDRRRSVGRQPVWRADSVG